MYKISIENLTFEAIIGILDFEREKPQKVVVECEISYQNKKEYIDYAKVVSFIKSTIIEGKFLLIEDALDEIYSQLLRKYPNIKKLKVKISKPDILQDCIVNVEKSI